MGFGQHEEKIQVKSEVKNHNIEPIREALHSTITKHESNQRPNKPETEIETYTSLDSANRKIKELKADNKKLVLFLKKMKVRVSQLNSQAPSEMSLDDSCIILTQRNTNNISKMSQSPHICSFEQQLNISKNFHKNKTLDESVHVDNGQ